MDLDLLKTFTLLARHKNFTKTAEIQNVVQSTVTARINELERQLNKKLFTRSNRQVELTAEGLTFLPFAQRILGVYEEGVNKLGAAETFVDYVSIATTDVIWQVGLAGLVKTLLVRNPNIATRIIIRHSYETIQLLMDGIVDIGFVARPPRSNKFEIVPCFQDDVILVASPLCGLSRPNGVTVREMLELPLLCPVLDDNFEEWTLQNIPLGHFFKFQVDVFSMLTPFLVEGYGPGLILRSLVREELAAGVLVEIPVVGENLLPKWKSHAIYEKSKGKLPAIQQWLQLLRDSGAGIGDENQ